MATTETIKTGPAYDGFTYQEAASLFKARSKSSGDEYVLAGEALDRQYFPDAQIFQKVINCVGGGGRQTDKSEGLIWFAYLFGLDAAVSFFRPASGPGRLRKQIITDYSGRVVVLITTYGWAGEYLPNGVKLLQSTLLEGPGTAAAKWVSQGPKIDGNPIREFRLVEVGLPPLWGAVCSCLSGAEAVIIDNRAGGAGTYAINAARGRGG